MIKHRIQLSSLVRPVKPGFTMIELVAAMIAASVLIAGLASAMLVTNRSLEDAATPVNRAGLIETVADRIAEDARYASAIQQVGQTISLTVPDRDGDGFDESIVYRSSATGLTRTQSPHPAVTFLSGTPSLAMRVDGYTSPTQTVPPTQVRLLGWTQMATTNRTWTTSVEVPGGARAGDLLVMVTAGDDSTIGPWGGGWSAIEYHEANNLFIGVFTRVATTTELTNQTIFAYSFNSNSIAAVVHCFNGDGRTMFDDNVLTSGGNANPGTGSGIPQPPQISTIPEHAMNLQILAIEQDPFALNSSGLTGFSDVGLATATSSGNAQLTLVTAIRNGKYTSSTPSAYHLVNQAEWSQVAMQWWP